MKNLFKEKDIIVNPLTGNGERTQIGIVEVPTVYTTINGVLTDTKFLNVMPVDTLDLEVRRANLCLIFENRAKFLFKNSIAITRANLENLSKAMLNKGIDFDIYSESYGIEGFIEKNVPYLLNATFYFSTEITNYTSIVTTVMTITSAFYNSIRINSINDKREIYTEELYNNINKIMSAFSQSLMNDIYTLCDEAKIIFNAGDYEEVNNTFVKGNQLFVALGEQEEAKANLDDVPLIDIDVNKFPIRRY